MSTHNANNWPPLQIDGLRVRAGYAGFSDSFISVTMPALKSHSKNALSDLVMRLNNQTPMEILFSRAVPRPKGEPATMCGGKFEDPNGYVAKLHWMDLRATAGDRIDLDLSFNVMEKMKSCAYGKSESNIRVLTWDDLNIEARDFAGESPKYLIYRPNEPIGELMLRMSPGLITGYFAASEYHLMGGIAPMMEREFYDIDEFDARITVGDLKLR